MKVGRERTTREIVKEGTNDYSIDPKTALFIVTKCALRGCDELIGCDAVRENVFLIGYVSY